MKISKFLMMIFTLIFLIAGCSKDILIEQPKDFIGPDNLYVNAAGFDSGLNGLYALFARERGGLVPGNSNNLLIDIAISGTDNAYGNQRSGWTRVGNEYNVRNVPEEKHNEGFFNYLYQVIGAANAIISRADNPDINWTETEKNRVVAEARLFRAWAYRHATYLYGDVPLTTEEASGDNIKSDWERTPVDTVRKQMLEDLLFAEANLPEKSANPGKLVKGVATHYLAELYLTLDDYSNSISKANSLINGGLYSLITQRYGVKANQPGTPFTDMFLDGNSNKSEGNTEVLWVMQNERDQVGSPVNIMRRWFKSRVYQISVPGVKNPFAWTKDEGGRGIGRVAPTKFAIDLYEPNDDRGSKFAWRSYAKFNNPDADFGTSGYKLGDTIFFDYQKYAIEPDRKNDWPSTRKWDDDANNIPNDPLNGQSRNYNDQIYLRLAETYLILAEAQLKNGNPAAAAITLNILRERSNASIITASDVTIDFILDERSRELWSEEHRRYSLVRNNKLIERYRMHSKRYSSSIGEKDKLMPIPQSVIDANTIDMPQNPGY